MEVTYKSTNAFGWPQLILSVFEIDSLGRGGAACRLNLPGSPRLL